MNNVLFEMKDSFIQLSAHDMDHLRIQLCTTLDETKGSVVGVLSNFSSLVIAYADYRDGQSEFACTALNEPLDAEEFVWRLLYVLTVSSDELVSHCLSARFEANKSETAEPYDAINLDDDYLSERDRLEATFRVKECMDLKRNRNTAFDTMLDEEDFHAPPLKRITVQRTENEYGFERLEEEEDDESSSERSAVNEEDDDDIDRGCLNENEEEGREEQQPTFNYAMFHPLILLKLRGWRR
jgi:hypothetical protein